MMSDFTPEVEIRPFRACAMQKFNITVIIGIVRPLWIWLWGRYHVPQHVFLVTCTTLALHRLSGLCVLRQVAPMSPDTSQSSDLMRSARDVRMLSLFIWTSRLVGLPVRLYGSVHPYSRLRLRRSHCQSFFFSFQEVY